MITRFYVDNYKCLVNFEYKPKPFELIIGTNGSGKTTVFEALDKVRQFVLGRNDALTLFPQNNSCRWDTRTLQIFEIDFLVSAKPYRYRLEINLSSSIYRVEKESIIVNGNVFFETKWEKAPKIHLSNSSYDDYDDSDPFADNFDHDGELRVVRWHGDDDTKLTLSSPNDSMLRHLGTAYRDILGQINFFKINPANMTSIVGKVEPRPNTDLSNFASYYLYLLQQQQGKMFEMIPHLRSAIHGFDSFAIEENFEVSQRNLQIVFNQLDKINESKNHKKFRYSFEELSDGQRALIALYTLVFCAFDENTTFLIDEPENYIALRELQPLIVLMEEQIRKQGGQIVLISHNPEFINMLTDRGQCVRFYREYNAHTRIAEFNPDSELTAAEIVARGWEDDE